MTYGVEQLVELYAAARPSLGAVVPLVLVIVFGVMALLVDLFELGTTRGPVEGQDGVSITAPYVAMVGTLLGLVGIGWQALRFEALRGSYFNGAILIDGLGLFASGIVLAATFVALLLSVGYCRRENLQLAEYYHLMLMAAAGMMLIVSTSSLVVIFVALELMSIPLYVLTGFDRTRMRSIEGALKYFFLGAFSTGFLVYGIAFIYGATGSLDLGAIPRAIEASPPIGFMMIGLALVVVGFAFKVALVPFHMWSPDAYEGAPSPVTGFMAVTVKAAGFVVLVRILVDAFGSLSDLWVPVLTTIAVLTMLVGNVAAIRQDNIKRMLAYSSIAHAGYLAVALVAHSEMGKAALLYYLAAYSAMTLGAFGIVVVLGGKGDEHLSIERDYAGLAFRRPLLGAAMAIFMFSLTGIPPTAGFIGKFAIFSAAIDAGYTALALIIVTASVISAFYYLKVVVAMYMRSASDEPAFTPVAGMATVALVVAVLGVTWLGVFPGDWIELARASAAGAVRIAGY